MRRTFNCGVGFVVVVSPGEAARALDHLQRQGLAPWRLGEVTSGHQVVEYV